MLTDENEIVIARLVSNNKFALAKHSKVGHQLADELEEKRRGTGETHLCAAERIAMVRSRLEMSCRKRATATITLIVRWNLETLVFAVHSPTDSRSRKAECARGREGGVKLVCVTIDRVSRRRKRTSAFLFRVSVSADVIETRKRNRSAITLKVKPRMRRGSN